MGLIERETQETGGVMPNKMESYAFPKIHEGEYPDVLRQFGTQSFMLSANIPVQEIAAFGYESATHEQFTHVTLPIRYNGVESDNYTPAEQEVLHTVNAYIMDRSRFASSTEKNQSDVVIAPDVIEADPRILRIKDPANEDNAYVQLIFRRALLPYEENTERVTDTEVINTGNMTVFHFKHPYADVSFEGTRL